MQLAIRRTTSLLAAAATALAVLPGCSVIMAATDAPKVHYEAIGVGSPRSTVIKTLGPPIDSQTTDDARRLDHYQFQGGIGERAIRSIGWAAADVLTLGIAEVVGTPFEAIKRADTLSATAIFDSGDALIAMEVRKEDGTPAAAVGDLREIPKTEAATITPAADAPSDTLSTTKP